MPKARVTVYICDNPECKVQHLHTKEQPAPGFHHTRTVYRLPDGEWPVGKLYACSATCLGKAVEAEAQKAVLAQPEGRLT